MSPAQTLQAFSTALSLARQIDVSQLNLKNNEKVHHLLGYLEGLKFGVTEYTYIESFVTKPPRPLEIAEDERRSNTTVSQIKIEKAADEKKTAEEKKAAKAAYMRDYFRRHPEKFNKKKKKAAKEEVVIVPVEPVVPDKKEEKPKKDFSNGYQAKINKKQSEDEKKFQSMILTCECYRHEKIVKGLEKVYKGKAFYQDRCIEDYVNAEMGLKTPDYKKEEEDENLA